MTLLIVFLALICLVVLIAVFKVNPFLAFLVIAVVAGLLLGIPVGQITHSVEKGIGDTLGSIVSIIVLGAMLGKLIADSGAAQQIASSIIQKTGVKNVQWALALAGFIIGLPLFYGTGFVLMVPLIFSIVYQYKLPAVSTGLPMLAALSVSFGFLPPHPAPSALVIQFGGNLGATLFYGILIAIPTIILAGPLFAKTLKNLHSTPLEIFQPAHLPTTHLPSVFSSFFAALFPVVLLMLTAVLPFVVPENAKGTINFLSQPTIVMLIALVVGTYILGIRQKRSMNDIMVSYGDAIKEISIILLVIGGAGALKQVLVDSGVSQIIADSLQTVTLPPLFLGWFLAAVIRVAVGSATVAGFTAAGIIQPLITQMHVNPNLMVLSIGAGSLMFSHVNDSGFWLFKEYFNLSIKDTLRSWSLMESIVSVAGLAGVLILDIFI